MFLKLDGLIARGWEEALRDVVVIGGTLDGPPPADLFLSLRISYHFQRGLSASQHRRPFSFSSSKIPHCFSVFSNNCTINGATEK